MKVPLYERIYSVMILEEGETKPSFGLLETESSAERNAIFWAERWPEDIVMMVYFPDNSEVPVML